MHKTSASVVRSPSAETKRWWIQNPKDDSEEEEEEEVLEVLNDVSS